MSNEMKNEMKNKEMKNRTHHRESTLTTIEDADNSIIRIKKAGGINPKKTKTNLKGFVRIEWFVKTEK